MHPAALGCMGDETTEYKLTTACRLSNVLCNRYVITHARPAAHWPKIGTCISWRSSSSFFPLEIPHEPARSAEPPLQPMFSNLAPAARPGPGPTPTGFNAGVSVGCGSAQGRDQAASTQWNGVVPGICGSRSRSRCGVAHATREVNVRGAVTSNSSRTGEVII